MSCRTRSDDPIRRWHAKCAAVEAAKALVGSPRPGDRWERRAARFDRVARERTAAGPALQALLGRVHPDDVVVDVGAGTGRHALRLAGHCARVVAVEPSEAMRRQLEANLREENATNVDVVPTPWPSAGPLPCDLIYSSHVVYGIADVLPFLDAMTRSARRECLLLLGERAPADVTNDLWRAVHGREHPARPAAPDAFEVLRAITDGVRFEILARTGYPAEFSDNDEDLGELCLRLALAPDNAGRERVRAALRATYTANADGLYVIGHTAPLALISWPGVASP